MGYKFTGFDMPFFVKPLDLPKKSEKTVCATCDVCGKEMSIAYAAYYKNIEKNNRYVCHLCSIPIRYENDLEQRRNNLWEKISVVAENNDYKIISDKNDIYRNSSYISYECKRHGVQSIRIGNLLSGKRCPDCARDIRRNMYKNSASKIKRMVDDCGGKILNIEEYINQDTRNLLFVCPECGKSFISSLKVYKQHGGQVCEECSNSESLGEKKIRVYLDNYKIHYEQEKYFYDCRDKAMLPFDFYLPDDNMIIELNLMDDSIMRKLTSFLILWSKHKNTTGLRINTVMIKGSYLCVYHTLK